MVSRLESVYGAAYAGAYGGLAQAMPRLSSLLVITILAAVGTPLSPAFSTLLALVTQSLSVVPGAAVIVLAVWFLWAWAGARMTGGMVVGPVSGAPRPDLTAIAVVPAASILLLLALAGAASLKYLL
jgi:NADH:ubiquinone oxidoreductase subunit 4 (subunit M)